jgi:co-chaperonin GroES (HSP10)
MNKEKFKPFGVNLIGEVTEFADAEKDGIQTEQKLASKTNVEYYYGIALKLGENVEKECPGLKEGNNIIFNQFSGFAINSTNGYCKILKGFDVVAIVKDNFNKMEKVLATKNRVLVEILDESVVQNGIYNDAGNDSRNADTQKGKILHCGPEAKQLPKGTVVLFDPYCGNLIYNEPSKKLKTIEEFDILCTLES